MLHPAVIAGSPNPFERASAAVIARIGDARRALERDPELARRYLDEVIAMVEPDAPDAAEHALVPAWPADGQGALARGGLTAWQLQRVTGHIERTLAGALPIEQLAEIARLSVGHFCRAFKVSVGETPHAFIVRRRVRHAQMLMLRTDEALSQIACASGLSDQAHLTRLFRRLVGTTPFLWRRAWRSFG